jgi:excisionase family DNA binding protein
VDTNSRIALKPAETADALGISRSKVYDLIASGQLPSVRIGNSLRVPVTALREWVDRQTTAGPEAA